MAVGAAVSVASRLSVNLRKQFAGSTSTEPGFSLDVKFTASAGFTVLFGHSGAGKSTILNCIAGLQAPDAGSVSIGDAVVFDSQSGINVPTRERHVGYLFQTLALFPHMSARQNIEYGLASLTPQERADRTQEIAESFGIAHILDRRPSQMSGGERQRVALARALVTRPRALLLDEPLTALDVVTRSRILDDLRWWNSAHAVPVLCVTHELEEVYALGSRVLVMEDGRILADGPPQEVLSRPRYESIAQLAGFENIFDVQAIATHEDQGTMTCRIGSSAATLEVPLTRRSSDRVKVGIRAGDILLATEKPAGLSARNVLPGTITSLRRQRVTVIAEVQCGEPFTVHLTPGACEALALQPGKPVWAVIKTYSCHVLEQASNP
jgi:molybdate transport system ATP-binding protein